MVELLGLAGPDTLSQLVRVCNIINPDDSDDCVWSPLLLCADVCKCTSWPLEQAPVDIFLVFFLCNAPSYSLRAFACILCCAFFLSILCGCLFLATRCVCVCACEAKSLALAIAMLIRMLQLQGTSHVEILCGILKIF